MRFVRFTDFSQHASLAPSLPFSPSLFFSLALLLRVQTVDSNFAMEVINYNNRDAGSWRRLQHNSNSEFRPDQVSLAYLRYLVLAQTSQKFRLERIRNKKEISYLRERLGGPYFSLADPSNICTQIKNNNYYRTLDDVSCAHRRAEFLQVYSCAHVHYHDDL